MKDNVVLASLFKTKKEKTRWQRFLDWWVIDPRNSRYLGYWDLATVLALFFVALVTPFEVAFLDSPRSFADIFERFESVGWLFFVNRLVDLLFLADLVLQFRLMYTESSTTEGMRWVSEPLAIVRHYLLSWFTIDISSIAVCAFDIIPLLPSGGGDATRSLRVMRVMRVLRLIKLIRLLRASRLFRRWETKLAINYSRLHLVRSIFNVCYVSHFFACVWGLMVALSETKTNTWAYQFQYCTPVAQMDPSSDAIVFGDFAEDDCVPDEPWALYSVSVYWAVMTITSIGYGDIHAQDNNIAEQAINTILMLTGAVIWGNLIGTFCGVVATMNPHTAEFNRRMDDLNRYVSQHAIDHDLRRRLREYLHQTRHLQMAAASKDLLTLLSPALQGEVTWAVNKKWLLRVAFFKGAEPEFLVQVSLSLTPLVFTPGELAINGYLYIVHRGIALYGGRVLTSGKVWGEDCIIHASHLQRRWCARAMNYLEVYMISRDDVLEVASAFPRTHEYIRKMAMRMAMRRQFILAAKMLAAQQGRSIGFSEGSHTFDRLLDQATTVPMAELRLQSSLIANRIETGSSALMKHASADLSGMANEEEEGSFPPSTHPAKPPEASEGASSSPFGSPSDPGAPVPNMVKANLPPSMMPNYGGIAPMANKPRRVVAAESSPAAADSGGNGWSADARRHDPNLDSALSFLKNKAESDTGPQAIPAQNRGRPAQESMSASMLRDELGAALDETRQEMGTKVDALSAQVSSLHDIVSKLVERLPAPS